MIPALTHLCCSAVAAHRAAHLAADAALRSAHRGADALRDAADRELATRERSAVLGELARLIEQLDIAEEAEQLDAYSRWNAMPTAQLWRHVHRLTALEHELRLQPRRGAA